MKTPLFFLFVFGIGFRAWAQDVATTQTVTILPKSNLTITGYSNIRDFKCVFNTDLLDVVGDLKIVFKGNMIYFENAFLELKSIDFDCGSRGINKDFTSLIKAEEHPTILLKLKEVELKEDNLAQTKVEISIAGETRIYDFPVRAINAEILDLSGKLTLNIQDFGLAPPKKFLGLIIIKEEIEIGFHLKVKH